MLVCVGVPRKESKRRMIVGFPPVIFFSVLVFPRRCFMLRKYGVKSLSKTAPASQP